MKCLKGKEMLVNCLEESGSLLMLMSKMQEALVKPKNINVTSSPECAFSGLRSSRH